MLFFFWIFCVRIKRNAPFSETAFTESFYVTIFNIEVTEEFWGETSGILIELTELKQKGSEKPWVQFQSAWLICFTPLAYFYNPRKH